MADEMMKRREEKKREIEAAKAAAKARQEELERKLMERDNANASTKSPVSDRKSKTKTAVVNFDDDDSNNDSIEYNPSLMVKEAPSPKKKSDLSVVDDAEDEIATILERRLQNQQEEGEVVSEDSKAGGNFIMY